MPQDQLQFSKLKGTRVLFLGGTSGLGFATARLSLEGGASTIVLSSSNPDNVNAAIDRLKSLYPTLSTQCEIIGKACDIGSIATMETNLEALLDFATEDGKRKVDHVVHTAGAPAGGLRPLAQSQAADFEKVATRAASVAMLTKLATSKVDGTEELRYLNPGPGSSLTFTGGSVDIYPQPNWHIPAFSSGGMVGLVKSLAATIAPVRVNLVGPGAVDTELWDKLGATEQSKAAMGAKLPLTQIGRPEDVAESYRACMCDRNMTGMVMRSEGGQGVKGS